MKNSLVRNIVQTFSTQIGSQILLILSGIVIARTLGPVGKGFLSYAMTIVAFVSVFCYGFGDAVFYQFGKKKQPACAVYAVTMRTIIVVLAIFLPILIIIAILVPSQRPLAVAAAVLPFTIYMQLMTPFLIVRERMLFVNIRTIVQNFGTATLTIPLILYWHLGLSAAVSVWILFYVVAAIQSALAIKPIIQSSPPINEESKNLMGEQIKFALRAAGVSVAGFMNMRINVFVVSIMFAPIALGWYTLAMASGELLWQVSRAFVWSALGRIGSYSFDDSAALVARLTRNTFAIVGSLGVIVFIIGPWLIVHVYGNAFAPAGNALRWALPGLVVYAAEIALTNFIILQLVRPLILIYIQSAAAITCATLTFTMAGKYGIVAAAASTSFTYLMVTGVLITLFVKNTNIPLNRLLFVQCEDLQYYTSLLKSLFSNLFYFRTKVTIP